MKDKRNQRECTNITIIIANCHNLHWKHQIIFNVMEITGIGFFVLAYQLSISSKLWGRQNKWCSNIRLDAWYSFRNRVAQVLDFTQPDLDRLQISTIAHNLYRLKWHLLTRKGLTSSKKFIKLNRINYSNVCVHSRPARKFCSIK